MAAIVVLRGNSELRKALRRFAPDLEKTLKKEIGAALRPVVSQAKGFVTAQAPMSGWVARSFSEARFPFYSASTIKRGITYTSSPSKVNSDGFSSMASVLNKSAAGSIYESAGRANNGQGQEWVGPNAGGASKGVSRSSNRHAGAQFIRNLPPLTGSLKGRGRLIFRAWAANQGRAEGAALKAIDKALTEFRRRSETTKFSKAA
jgi:hypothetical protein